jgi:CPA2 family monovalent cation:H+ antiporter-2
MAGSILQDALIYLGAALVFVPVAKKLGIGSVLGYILAGVIIGPFVLGLVGEEGEDVMHAAEFGVVMMLFVIGLELSPQAFWKMKKRILGMGGLQMLLSALLLFPVFFGLFQFAWQAALALSLSFAMSSTAIVLQTLKEKGLEKTAAGTSSFAVLLFQDIAVIPILASLPLLAGIQSGSGTETHAPQDGIVGFLQSWPSVAIAAAVLGVFLISRYLINPFLHLISRVHVRELFTAAALFIVCGVAWMMAQAGLSAALGAFMAGVLLANSEFRHELESDIEPFKGLLLGIFFTSVGSTIHFGVIGNEFGAVIGVVLLIMTLKAVVLAVLGRFAGMASGQGVLFALLLSQVGEFVFVLLGSITQFGMLEKSQSDFWMAVITISMVLSPLMLFVYDKISTRLMARKPEEQKAYEVNPQEEQRVIIAGFGHFGSTLGRFLRANGVNATILDNDSQRVTLLRKMGFEVYFGDATRPDLLEAAGAAKAHILISAIDDPERNEILAETVHKHFQHLKLFMRAKNRMDAYQFMEMGVPHIYRESLHTSVYMGVDVLHSLGKRRYTSLRKANDFIRYDTEALNRLAGGRGDTESYISSVREEIALQERLLKEDRKFMDDAPDNAWDNTPLKS